MADNLGPWGPGQYNNGSGPGRSPPPRYGLNVEGITPEIGQRELKQIFESFGPCAVFRSPYSSYGRISYAHREDCEAAFHIMRDPDNPLHFTVSLKSFDEEERNIPNNRHSMDMSRDIREHYAAPYGCHPYDNNEPYDNPRFMGGMAAQYPPQGASQFTGYPPRDSRSDSRAGYGGMGNTMEVGPCIGCRRPTSHWCTLCGAPSCSDECQKAYWEKHRQVCFIPRVSYGGSRGVSRGDVNDTTERLASLSCGGASPGENGNDGRRRNEFVERKPLLNRPSEDKGTDSVVERKPLMKEDKRTDGQNRENRSSSFSSQNGHARDASGRSDQRWPQQNDGRSDQRRGDEGQGNFPRGPSRGDQRQNFRGARDDQRQNFRGDGGDRRSDRGYAGDRRQNGHQDSNEHQSNNRTNGGGRFGGHRSTDKEGSGSPRLDNGNQTPPANGGTSRPAAGLPSPASSVKFSDLGKAAPKSPDATNVGALKDILKSPLSSKPQVSEGLRPAAPKTFAAEEGVCVVLKCGDTVTLNMAQSTDSLYLSPPLSSCPLFVEKSAELQKQCEAAPALGREPRVKELVACRFDMDNQFYRGVVEDVLPGKEYNILFIDFGNVQASKVDKLKALPDDQKVHPRNAVEVRLRDVDAVPVADKLAELVTQLTETELKLTFDGALENGVELFTSNGENINEKFRQLIGGRPKTAAPAPSPAAAPAPSPAAAPAPSPAAAPAPSPAAAPAPSPAAAPAPSPVDDAPKEGWDLGMIRSFQLPVGQTFPIIVFDIVGEFHLSGCNAAEAERLQFYQGEFPEKIAEACARDPNPFYPTVDQMCLAKYESDNLMYRAYTVEVLEDGKRKLFFVDYGNVATVEPKDIRKITRELNEPLALATTFMLAGIEETAENWARIKHLFDPNEAHIFKEVTAKYGGDFAEVTIPEVLALVR